MVTRFDYYTTNIGNWVLKIDSGHFIKMPTNYFFKIITLNLIIFSLKFKKGN